MKIKIFSEKDEPTDRYGYCTIPLERRINDFIEGKDIIDIKYQSDICGYANENAHQVDEIERALIIYKEK